MRIRCSAESDVGRGRSLNEDYYAIDGDHGFFVVADGMGGHGNGDVASRIAAEAVCRSLSTRPLRSRLWRGGNNVEQNMVRLRRALEDANRRVLSAASENSSFKGMGATAVVIELDGENGILANVGDSRAYRLRAGTLRQLTDDHTWVREQVSAGLLSESQALRHPFRSVVTRALGGDEEVIVDVQELNVEAGDLYLLCSDGLTAALSDEEIRRGLMGGAPTNTLSASTTARSLKKVCRHLIDAANERGGPDNITVVVVSVEL